MGKEVVQRAKLKINYITWHGKETKTYLIYFKTFITELVIN